MSKRKPFQGVAQIARYNARFYLAAPVICGAFSTAAKARKVPRALRLLAAAGAAGTAWWTIASLLASHWVYDRSPLMRWRWLSGVLQGAPRRWANLHCGLDESSAALRELFPDSEGHALDFFDAFEMSEPSIEIARRLSSASEKSRRVDLRALPFADNFFDAIFLFFSAHEIRDAQLRRVFFGEVHRVLNARGRVVLVEHPRDAMNFAAFGPGFFHFWPRREWRTIARESGFCVKREFAFTPFVRVWVLTKV